ncbi:MAG: hypothetical protein ISR76_09760, partial [Planctomycetes bacterium]|nr:hypothetical protein [Planctomycetota bacterium]
KGQQGETPPNDPPPDAQPPPDVAPPDFEPPPELSPEELEELLERLAQQELDKERQRRLRRKRPGGVERDW